MDLTQLQTFIKDKNISAATKELERLLKVKPSPEEEGQATVKILQLSMELDNLLAQEEIALLKNASTELKDLSKKQRLEEEKNKLEDIKRILE